MEHRKIYHDIAAEFTEQGRLIPSKVEWDDKSIYEIGNVTETTEYVLEKKANIGPCMDICAHGKYLYVIQSRTQYESGRLCVLTPDMKLVKEFSGIGNARQIEISGNIAVITAREDGLWIFNIQEITPVLLAHYQTIELATGVTLYANFAFVSCRQYGVEIVDITNPSVPRHVGIIRIGEVQSACVYEGYLYCGVWGAMCVIIVDIRDILKPREVARIPLEGRGDGVFAWDGKLYAVTGQHHRGIQNVNDEQDPCFGEGNGLVVFDISNPGQPRVLHSESFGKCYNISFDMWEPQLCGDLIVSGCSSLGVFACDKDTFKPRFRLVLPSVAGEQDAVTGFASLGETLYICGGRSDLFAFHTEMALGECLKWDIDTHLEVEKQPLHICCEDTISLKQRYSPSDAPVLGLCDCGDAIAVACGNGGIRLLNKETFAESAPLSVKGCCYDVKYADGYLAAALSDEGIMLCKKEKNTLRPISHIKTAEPVQQLCVSADGRYLLCGSGSTQCLLWDITEKEYPTLVAWRKAAMGPLYGDNFTSEKLADGTMLMFWHRDGLVYTNPSAGDLKFHTIFYPKSKGFMQFGPESGCDTDGTRIFYGLDGGYLFLPMEENIDADSLPIYRTQVPIGGKFTLCGNLLVACERARGIITVTDISNVIKPEHVGTGIINASPGKPVSIQGRIFIPGGYGGLLEVHLLSK